MNECAYEALLKVEPVPGISNEELASMVNPDKAAQAYANILSVNAKQQDS